MLITCMHYLHSSLPLFLQKRVAIGKGNMRWRERRKKSSRTRGGWDGGGGGGGEKQIWRLGWWECTALHRCAVPLGNLRCEQIQLYARVSRKEPHHGRASREAGWERLAGWRYYCIKTSDPGHHHYTVYTVYQLHNTFGADAESWKNL